MNQPNGQTPSGFGAPELRPSLTFYFGSRLPMIVDLLFYLLAGLGMWQVVPRLARWLAYGPALAVSWAATVAVVGLWALQWRQRIIVTSQGIEIWRGVFLKDRTIHFDQIVAIHPVAEPREALEVQLNIGERLQVVRINRKKDTAKLLSLTRRMSDAVLHD